jgi:tyrosyl-tRNA synthetase
MDLLTLCKMIPTRSEGRRLIQQGGVTVNEEKVASIDVKITAQQLKDGVKIRKGKKVYHKAILK